MPHSVIIIGCGFAGLSAASFMAKQGWRVTVLEKNAEPGGRAGQLKVDGFSFDTGPGWYWMPDIFESYFGKFGKKVSDYYSLQRLDPSYRVYWEDDYTNVPAGFEELKKLFEDMEPGSAVKLVRYLNEAAYKYETGMQKLAYKPGLSFTEFLDWDIIKGCLRLDIFSSIKTHIRKHFKNPRLRRLMEFPVLFLGAVPENTPALYSLMNYADSIGGTWYPRGGMYSVVKAMHEMAVELGVKFNFREEAKQIIVEKGYAAKVITTGNTYKADVIISGADYHFTETVLLPAASRSYTASWWDKRILAPSCLLYYVGLNKKLENVAHHNLFFDTPFEQHANEIYKTPHWPTEPMFYAGISSITDPLSAPGGCENLVLLVPVAAGLQGDTDETREKYFKKIISRMEKLTRQSIADAVICKKTFSVSDFATSYNAYRGNAYGLANTLKQTANFKPSCKSRKVHNLFYTGQFTVPGPGVPSCLISGEVVAGQVVKEFL